MTIYNLTGSPVTIAPKNGERRTFKPERFVAKPQQDEVQWDDTEGMPTSKIAWHVSGLPAPQKDTLYIVQAGVILTALVSGRTVADLRAPANSTPGHPGVYERLVMA